MWLNCLDSLGIRLELRGLGLTGNAVADRSHAGGPQGPATPPMAARHGRCGPVEICSGRAGTGTLELARPVGRTHKRAYGDLGWTDGGNRNRQPGLSRPQLSFGRLASPAGTSAGARHQRSVRIDGVSLARSPSLA